VTSPTSASVAEIPAPDDADVDFISAIVDPRAPAGFIEALALPAVLAAFDTVVPPGADVLLAWVTVLAMDLLAAAGAADLLAAAGAVDLLAAAGAVDLLAAGAEDAAGFTTVF
jgi:hypothetical protein